MTINDLKGKYTVVGVHPSAPTPPPAPSGDFLSKAANVATSIFPGTGAIGEGLGTAIANIGRVAQGKNPNIPVNVPKMAGGILEAGSLPVSIGAAAPASLVGAAAQYGGLGATSAAGASLEQGNSLPQVGTDALKGGAASAATGAVFNLLGKGISYATKKLAPSVASVTSGVPKAAIEQAAANPVAAKEGLGMSVAQIRAKADASLQSLYNDLNAEHSAASSALSSTAAQDTSSIAQQLLQKAKDVTTQFKVPTAASSDGIVADFSKSAIVNSSEQSAVQKALDTVSTWDDFSPKGLQALNQRVNALKNFDSSGVSKSSAIIGKIHNAIGDVIKETAPELSTINENYSKNRAVLDEIGNVLGSSAQTPTQIQSSVTRLDNIFKENKDEYVNIIRELGKRSGVDYLSLLAGGEFQRFLPGYIRSAVAVGSVGGVGAVASNPMSLLLLPLFSPRVVGAVARNAKNVANISSQLVRAGATQAIRQTVPAKASQ
jgi:hypothetical protein